MAADALVTKCPFPACGGEPVEARLDDYAARPFPACGGEPVLVWDVDPETRSLPRVRG
ncbi:hypothetical protein G3I71_44700 [Streptomyces sp. SID12501]|uniref:Uncharacterized protein n=1 Tax=Streptomyces sp. SID12501 TaxID=2706042 RepID=A0A6B3C8C3_9ACTN|nr:hypothetical protein [Streptomyces sp. SID12501]